MTREDSVKQFIKPRPAWENHNWKGYGMIPGKFYYNIMYNAKKRNLACDITILDLQDLYVKQDGKCYYTGRQLSLSPKALRTVKASIDRLDSSKGYTLDNIVFCSAIINVMKNTLTEAEFVLTCNEVVERLNHGKSI